MIIESLKVKNFKMLKEFEYNMAENINLIFGENGAGKTSITEIFNFYIQLNIKKFISYKSSFEEESAKKIEELFNDKIFDYYKNYSTHDNLQDNIILEINFIINEKPVFYMVEIDSENTIKNEVLKIRLDKRMAIIFNRSTKKFHSTIEKIIKPYYYFFTNESKTTYLSIFKYLINIEFDESVIETSALLEYIKKMTNQVITDTEYHNRVASIGIRKTLEEVNNIKNDSYFDKSYQNFINRVDRFSNFITEIDDSIIECKSVMINDNDDFKSYKLAVVKKLNNKEIVIPMNLESSGTRNYLKYFDWIDRIINEDGGLYVSDEFGLHLHENLQNRIFEYLVNLSKKNKLQFVITTHSSNLLNVDYISKKEKQILLVNAITGQRSIKNFIGVDAKENYSSKYLSGIYGGAPRSAKLRLFDDGL